LSVVLGLAALAVPLLDRIGAGTLTIVAQASATPSETPAPTRDTAEISTISSFEQLQTAQMQLTHSAATQAAADLNATQDTILNANATGTAQQIMVTEAAAQATLLALSWTPTLRPTTTPVPPTSTLTPTLRPTTTPVPPTSTLTPTFTPTFTPTPTPTDTPIYTPTPLPVRVRVLASRGLIVRVTPSAAAGRQGGLLENEEVVAIDRAIVSTSRGEETWYFIDQTVARLSTGAGGLVNTVEVTVRGWILASSATLEVIEGDPETLPTRRIVPTATPLPPTSTPTIMATTDGGSQPDQPAGDQPTPRPPCDFNGLPEGCAPGGGG
jgi:hypothetical protein